jgi:hypothetical protein
MGLYCESLVGSNRLILQVSILKYNLAQSRLRGLQNLYAPAQGSDRLARYAVLGCGLKTRIQDEIKQRNLNRDADQ